MEGDNFKFEDKRCAVHSYTHPKDNPLFKRFPLEVAGLELGSLLSVPLQFKFHHPNHALHLLPGVLHPSCPVPLYQALDKPQPATEFPHVLAVLIGFPQAEVKRMLEIWMRELECMSMEEVQEYPGRY